MAGIRFPSLKRMRKDLGWHDLEEVRRLSKLSRLELIKYCEQSRLDYQDYYGNPFPTYKIRLRCMALVVSCDLDYIELRQATAMYLDIADDDALTIFYYNGGYSIDSVSAFSARHRTKIIKGKY